MHAPLPSTADQRHRAGLFFGLGAYLVWGVMPLYFKALAHVSPGEILAYRIVWSLLLLGGLATLWRRWPAIRTALADRRVLLTLLATAALISANWLVYIIAVISGHVLEASLGYFINPLLNVALGMIVLGERIGAVQKAAVAVAALGVAVLAIAGGGALWISLTLAFSFGVYGLIRKVAAIDALGGLTIETALLVGPALAVLWLSPEPVFGRGTTGGGSTAR